MASDIFLKLDGIEGESTDDKHKGEIDVLSWSFGAVQAPSHTGFGGSAGKISIHEIQFTMKMSKASPKIFLVCATGDHIKKAVLTLRKAGKEQQEFFVAHMDDCLITSYQTGASQGNEIPTESISMSFHKLALEYKEQKADGSLGGAVKAGFDARANKKL